jgi:hypothetical protein
VLDGELVYVPPAEPPQGRQCAKVGALLVTHAGVEFEVGISTLIRTSKIDDFACHLTVWPAAPDPRTGGRQLPQLAIEIADTASLAHSGRKAAKLAARGVRRVLAIDVERSRALEWSAEIDAWTELDPAGRIEDPTLAVPLPIVEMLHARRADDAVARALIAKRHPVVMAYFAESREEARAAGFQEGLADSGAEGYALDKARGIAEAVLTILAARKIAVGDAVRVRVLGESDLVQLDRWIAKAVTCADVAELFTTSGPG